MTAITTYEEARQRAREAVNTAGLDVVEQEAHLRAQRGSGPKPRAWIDFDAALDRLAVLERAQGAVEEHTSHCPEGNFEQLDRCSDCRRVQAALDAAIAAVEAANVEAANKGLQATAG